MYAKPAVITSALIAQLSVVCRHYYHDNDSVICISNFFFTFNINTIRHTEIYKKFPTNIKSAKNVFHFQFFILKQIFGFFLDNLCTFTCIFVYYVNMYTGTCYSFPFPFSLFCPIFCNSCSCFVFFLSTLELIF